MPRGTRPLRLRAGKARRLAACLVLGLAAGCAVSGPGGTQAPYSVRGRSYVPLADWHGFTEEGLASWYGGEHQGRPTANGERFDTRAMTAAHPILPMNTCLLVEDLSSGRTVTVRVNDRGPFVDGRVVDLSRAAAEALGLVGPGTSRVRLRAIGEADLAGRCQGLRGERDRGPGPSPGPLHGTLA